MSEQRFLFDDFEKPEENPWDIDAAEEVPAVSVVFAEGIEKPLDYALPEGLVGKVQRGCRVEVPLGKSNRPCAVFCVDVHMIQKSKIKLKFVSRILDERPLLSPSMLELTRWIGEYWLCPWGQVLQCVLPAGVRSQAGTRVATLLGISKSGRAALDLWNLQGRESGMKLTPAQVKILEALRKAGRSFPPEELARRAGVSPGPVRTLRERGFLTENQERIRTGAEEYEPTFEGMTDDLQLNSEQQKALDEIHKLLNSRDGKGEKAVRTALLHGVTGSGKTEVYIQAIREVVRGGRQAIVLVPEISLTPQTVQRFRSRFENIAVLHSHLTDAQRHFEWERILRGDVEVVIGARSAVFAPTPRLGLIVIDEEHETSFKQDTAPRYHARDVAVERARREGAVVILGSATPSLESWHATETGEYRLISLEHRVASRPLPEVSTVDLRVRDSSSHGAIGRKLHVAIVDALRERHQVILLLNRRGFSTHIQCPACGTVLSCPHCEISLTHHFATNELICHYCDYHAPIPRGCPECGSPAIRYSGMGTQKLEVEIEKRFPNANVLRMDTDSMQARDAHEKAFDRFRKGEIDILLGTQMIAKGLDFPNVTLVGVINADTALHLPDFRAEERTFHLITQVAGRTGRGEDGGTVLVQSFQPENSAITFACKHDFRGFAQYALPLRKALGYPPYGFLARVVIRGTDESRTRAVAEQLGASIRNELTTRGRVLGPAPCPIVKLRDFFRFHIQVQSPERPVLRDALARVASSAKVPDDVQWIIDLDPSSMV